jgi:hypothetical protein
MRPPIDLRRALEDLRRELELAAWSTSYSLQDRDRKLRVVSMIDAKLAGRLGGAEDIQAGIEALPDGWR